MLISKWLVAFVAVYGGLGGVLFDAVIPATARQHQGNPAWPPHAKFHNGQTMMLGVLNMVLALVVLFALPPTLPTLLVAAALAEIYFASMLLAPLFPGTAWSDPEFADLNPHPLGIPIQKLLSLLATGVVLVAVALAVVPR
ncbi:DUF6640 family protein [Methylobacterium sp. sgz302541]|uniref:DUF6640 family protein n=1 Tax=unclassified Methylobacterium TaxID=2615210 RepID=UPI003D342A06